LEPEARLNLSGRWRSVRLARLIWKLPMYARVIWGLVRDPRTPLPLKGLLAAGLAYLVMPFDLIPDAIPILGQADDLTVLMLVLDLFIANPRPRSETTLNAPGTARPMDRDLARLITDGAPLRRIDSPELLESASAMSRPTRGQGPPRPAAIRRGALPSRREDHRGEPGDDEWELRVRAGVASRSSTDGKGPAGSMKVILCRRRGSAPPRRQEVKNGAPATPLPDRRRTGDAGALANWERHAATRGTEQGLRARRSSR
jgi:uncharacterized membrane protein YkvA (DUF1232 family)